MERKKKQYENKHTQQLPLRMEMNVTRKIPEQYMYFSLSLWLSDELIRLKRNSLKNAFDSIVYVDQRTGVVAARIST